MQCNTDEIAVSGRQEFTPESFLGYYAIWSQINYLQQRDLCVCSAAGPGECKTDAFHHSQPQAAAAGAAPSQTQVLGARGSDERTERGEGGAGHRGGPGLRGPRAGVAAKRSGFLGSRLGAPTAGSPGHPLAKGRSKPGRLPPAGAPDDPPTWGWQPPTRRVRRRGVRCLSVCFPGWRKNTSSADEDLGPEVRRLVSDLKTGEGAPGPLAPPPTPTWPLGHVHIGAAFPVRGWVPRSPAST